MTAAQLGRDEAGARWEMRLRVEAIALVVDGRTSTGKQCVAEEQCSSVPLKGKRREGQGSYEGAWLAKKA